MIDQQGETETTNTRILSERCLAMTIQDTGSVPKDTL
ncbi:uncharacterized protein CLUP02_12043 [Colletotrichum lupini]|uniref:Uncharacterized protein n=1 Tax=Colletotrichum lupini TaxID=145971 RepID=A0A9Q8WKE6_9PEZI|nr:uncharacterized protein CLUP02_12043 [Colletotrichum lupini]UQC86541.1 hypothetical protein CLUP02_12043 [Colletotrichum lupini]